MRTPHTLPTASVIGILIASALLGALPPQVAQAVEPASGAASDVVIDELANGDGADGAFSFFELRNAGDVAVDLRGWNVFRCSAEGLRANVGRPEAVLDDVLLEPGERFTVARVGAQLPDGRTADARFTQPYDRSGFGLILVGPDGRRMDAVGVYPSDPAPVASECTEGANLPETLAFTSAPGESWQRVARTGDVVADFVRATATPGGANVARAERPVAASVRIDEVAAAGPAGSGDDLVELGNPGDTAVEVGGWSVFRCTAAGTASRETRQYTFPAGHRIAAGGRFVIGGPGFTRRAGEPEPDVRAATSLADTTFGVLLADASGRRIDQVSVSNGPDTACQLDASKLESVLDARAGESWQRVADPVAGGARFVIAPRTPGEANATSERSVFRTPFAYDGRPGIAVSELADDPSSIEGATQQNFVELGNYGDATADLSGWRLVQCGVDGAREQATLVTIADGTRLAPGEAWTAALDGTEAAASADARFATAFDFLGTGVWVEDAGGRRVDSVGVYLANEMDEPNERRSPCTKGVSLTTFQPDRLRGETYQRSRFTGTDAGDFVVKGATPGTIDRAEWVEAAVLAQEAAAGLAATLGREREDAAVRLVGRDASTRVGLDASTGGGGTARARRLVGDGAGAIVLEAARGATEGGGLVEHRASGEVPLPTPDAATGGAAGLAASDDAFAFPYLRLVLDATDPDLADGGVVSWTGHGAGRAELALSVRDPDADVWRRLDARSGADGSTVTLSGRVRAGETSGGRVELLVQSAPRRADAARHGADGAFEDPDDYDLAISHITDTQYLSEAYPEVYADVVGWIAANADSRKIAFATHTGDLVQNWVDPGQREDRARREFAVASTMQAVLDDAGVPNSVLPGNHDNKRGASNDLFNEYFGPSRYSGRPWYAGSIAPDDNSGNFSTFERDGARFLMLSLPYAYGERELDWAEGVVAGHPAYNVIVSTHEHVTPELADVSAGRSTGSRWLSRGGELWSRVIAPNRNVIAVLSGHFHGLGRIVTEDAGGLDGHTVVEMLADYQEFRTHTGERATGFQRLLQLDLGGGRISVDTISSTLDAAASHPYDYEQFRPEDGSEGTPSNSRPWRILADGLQDRYTAEDDDFSVDVTFQYPKLVETEALLVAG
ncbi:lamin tail domain-containing protein [Agromyces sp. PvR057]|uniref:lamin tail domain-containing protein n=1 Tax=Agromyces sp. PvR057 TaxID=3156403 RepID=UPI003397222B